MSLHKPSFPEPPYTASVYFNYAAFLSGAGTGRLQSAPHIVDTMNVLAGNGTASKVLSQDVVDFFNNTRAVAALASDTPVSDFLCVFAPRKGKALYIAPGPLFPESKPDLRFAVEDTIEGLIEAKKTQRRVIGVFGSHGEPGAARKELRAAMKDITSFVVSGVHEIPALLKEQIDYLYLTEQKLKTFVGLPSQKLEN